MKYFLIVLPLLFLSTSGAFGGEKGLESNPAFEKRCGWVNNPTPANWDLMDKDGTWLIGAQGGRQAEGDLPAFPEGKAYWKKTNGNYGYGCACLTVKVDRKEKAFVQIKEGQALPLARCRADKSLPLR